MTTVQDDLDARDNLVYIAERWPDLRARLRREGGDPLTGRVSGGSKEPPLVIDIHISDLMHEIEEEARSLAHVLCDELTVTVDVPGTINGTRVRVPRTYPWAPRTSAMPGLLAEVAQHFGHWTTADERTALAFCDWAHEYSEKVRRALERPASAEYLGPCLTQGEDGTICQGDVYLRPDRGRARCRECGRVIDLVEHRAWVAERLGERLMRQSGIRAALVILGEEVGEKTLQSWVQRGRLAEVHDKLYRLSDARDLAAAHHERMKARRTVGVYERDKMRDAG